MNVRPKKIILAGDSAGGNLAFSLMGLILKNKLPVSAVAAASCPDFGAQPVIIDGAISIPAEASPKVLIKCSRFMRLGFNFQIPRIKLKMQPKVFQDTD